MVQKTRQDVRGQCRITTSARHRGKQSIKRRFVEEARQLVNKRLNPHKQYQRSRRRPVVDLVMQSIRLLRVMRGMW